MIDKKRNSLKYIPEYIFRNSIVIGVYRKLSTKPTWKRSPTKSGYIIGVPITNANIKLLKPPQKSSNLIKMTENYCDCTFYLEPNVQPQYHSMIPGKRRLCRTARVLIAIIYFS